MSGNAVALTRRLGIDVWRVPLGGLSCGRIAHELGKLSELLLRETRARRRSRLRLLSSGPRSVCTGQSLHRATRAAFRGKMAKLLALVALDLRLVHSASVGRTA